MASVGVNLRLQASGCPRVEHVCGCPTGAALHSELLRSAVLTNSYFRRASLKLGATSSATRSSIVTLTAPASSTRITAAM